MFMEKEVEEGIKFLNEKCPGWEKRVNWESLNMGNHETCIGGQLGGDYFVWAKSLGVHSESQAQDLGLNIRVTYRPGMSYVDELDVAIANYIYLGNTWKTKMGVV